MSACFCGEISMSLLFIQVDLILIKILIQKILTCNWICWNSFSPCSNLCSCFPIGQRVHLFFFPNTGIVYVLL